MSEERRVVVVACAGMDKPLGSVARASAFEVVGNLKLDSAALVCIPPLVAGVTPHQELIKKYPVITVDGCSERCATRIVAKSGGRIKGRILVPQSAQKFGLKPKAAADIGVEGEKLAAKIAEETALLIDKILGSA